MSEETTENASTQSNATGEVQTEAAASEASQAAAEALDLSPRERAAAEYLGIKPEKLAKMDEDDKQERVTLYLRLRRTDSKGKAGTSKTEEAPPPALEDFTPDDLADPETAARKLNAVVADNKRLRAERKKAEQDAAKGYAGDIDRWMSRQARKPDFRAQYGTGNLEDYRPGEPEFKAIKSLEDAADQLMARDPDLDPTDALEQALEDEAETIHRTAATTETRAKKKSGVTAPVTSTNESASNKSEAQRLAELDRQIKENAKFYQ